MKHDTRDPGGRYDAGDERVCVCGHTRGVHSERGIACFAGDDPQLPPPHGAPEPCDCERFRGRRVKKNPSMKVPRAKWFSVGGAGEPYPERLRDLDGKSGAYLIRVNGGRVAYVGESHTGNLRKTLTRHFQEWKRSGKKAFWESRYGQQHDPGTIYDRGRCEVAVFLTSADRAVDLETELIRRYRPTDNLGDVPF